MLYTVKLQLRQYFFYLKHGLFLVFNDNTECFIVIN